MFVVALYCFFAYWTMQSILKYYDEPAITSIDYHYSNSLNPNGNHQQLPVITFCDIEPLYLDTLIQECQLNEVKVRQAHENQNAPYLDLIEQCLSLNKNLNLSHLITLMKYPR